MSRSSAYHELQGPAPLHHPCLLCPRAAMGPQHQLALSCCGHHLCPPPAPAMHLPTSTSAPWAAAAWPAPSWEASSGRPVHPTALGLRRQGCVERSEQAGGAKGCEQVSRAV